MAKDNNTNEENGEKNIRKLQRTGRAGMSYMVTLPKDMIDELGWRERQKVTVKKDGSTLIIKDWESEN